MMWHYFCKINRMVYIVLTGITIIAVYTLALCAISKKRVPPVLKDAGREQVVVRFKSTDYVPVSMLADMISPHYNEGKAADTGVQR
jgi:hypothetical protein